MGLRGAIAPKDVANEHSDIESPPRRSLRARPKPSAKAQLLPSSMRRIIPSRRQPGAVEELEPTSVDVEATSKRRKLNRVTEDDSAMSLQIVGSRSTTVEDLFPSGPNGEAPVTQHRSKKRSSVLANARRFSALNLHNYPSDHHPVGIAIYLLQKIDQARRFRSRSASTSCSETESKAPPKLAFHSQASYSTLPPSTSSQTHASSFPSQVDANHTSPNRLHPPWTLFAANQQLEEDNTRLQSQRNRKSKQRSENWAKNKENDVVARAKLEAKKKFGPDQAGDLTTDAEKQEYIQTRTKYDYGRLLSRHAFAFAHDMVKLPPFQLGFGDGFFDPRHSSSGLDEDACIAGKLVTNTFPALTETAVSTGSQAAVDALIRALEAQEPTDDSFLAAIRTLATHEEVLSGVDRILRQLFGQKLASTRTSELRLDQGVSASVSIKQEACTPMKVLEEKPVTTSPAAKGGSKPPKDPVLQSPAPVSMSPPTVIDSPPRQPRSSGRERKPTAKVLAKGGDAPFSRSSSVSNVACRTAPRVSSKLNISHTAENPQNLRPSGRSSPTCENHTSSLAESMEAVDDPEKTGHSSGSTQSRQNSFSDTSSKSITSSASSALVHGSTKTIPQNAVEGQELYPINPQLVKNILSMAELVLSMSDSDEEVEPEDAPTVRKKVTFEQPVAPARQQLLPGPTPPVFQNLTHTATRSTSPSPHMLTRTSPVNVRDTKVAPAIQTPASTGNTALAAAQKVGLTYPEIPRPYSKDGWKMTGQVTDHGAEIVELDTRLWSVRRSTNKSSRDKFQRITSKAQAAEDRVYGHPPLPGQPNKPGPKVKRLQDADGNELDENAEYEITMHQLRKAAQDRGLGFNRSLTWEQLYAMIQRFDDAIAPVLQPTPPSNSMLHSLPATTSITSLQPPQATTLSPEATSVISKQLPRIQPPPPRISPVPSGPYHALYGRPPLSPAPPVMSPVPCDPQRRQYGGPPLSPAPVVMSPAYHHPLPPPPPLLYNHQGHGFNQAPYGPVIPSASRMQGTSPPLRVQTRRSMTSDVPQPYITSNGFVVYPPNSVINGQNIPPHNPFINVHTNPVSKNPHVHGSRDSSSSSSSSISDQLASRRSALNGGPPGGGAIINVKETMVGKKRKKTKGPDFRMNVNGLSDTPRHTHTPVTDHVRGGSIMRF